MKNTGIGKWIELWMDSAGERVYQPALVSALLHSGFTILHNTSHNSLELGKDVICRDPDGSLIALQLKGNPGTRLTISQWHQLYAQVTQLVGAAVPIAVTGGKLEQHRPILVTNGEVEEDVVAAITNFNQNDVPKYAGAKPLEIWKRGELLSIFSKAADSVWPADLKTQLLLQKATVADSENSIKETEIQYICTAALDWDNTPSTQQSLSKISGLATLLSIVASPYVTRGNYYEALKVKVIGLCIAAGYASKHGLSSKKHKAMFESQRADISDLLEAFAEGLSKQYLGKPFLNRTIFEEFGLYHARKILVLSLASAFVLERKGAVSDAIRKLVTAPLDYPFLASERVIPAFFSVFWAKDVLSSGYQNELECCAVLHALIESAKSAQLPSAYYRIEDVAAWQSKLYLGRSWHPIDDDSRKHSSQFARVTHALLAKRNWKQTCKQTWPQLTKTLETFTRLHDVNEFGLALTQNSTEEDRFIPQKNTWDELIKAIVSEPKPAIPELILNDHVLLLLVLVFLPHRANYELILHLDKEFGICWYK